MGRIQPGAVIGGLGLLLVGAWLLIADLSPQPTGSQGLQLVGFDRLWPVVPIIAGLAFLIQYALEPRKRGGLVFLGLIVLLGGLLLCAFTFEIGRLSWADTGGYWPIFLIIAGAAFVVLYVADGMREPALMRPAYLIGGAGLLALPFTLGIIHGEVIDQMVKLWPLLLVPVILAVFVQLRAGARGRGSRDSRRSQTSRSETDQSR
jgi:hypothetical protein